MSVILQVHEEIHCAMYGPWTNRCSLLLRAIENIPEHDPSERLCYVA